MSESQLTAQHSDSNHNSRVIRSPRLASGCVAICVFSSIVAFFFGNLGACLTCGSRLIYKVLNPELALLIDQARGESSGLVDDKIFLNLFLLSIAAFAGYLFTGALKRWVGLVPLLFAGLFGALYMITRLPLHIGDSFLPSFLFWSLPGGWSVRESAFFIWLVLSVLVIPIIYLIGSIRQKTIPIWKSCVLVLAPAITIVFGLFPAFVLRGAFRPGFFYWFSWAMFPWILFAVVIFSELRRTKAKQSDIRLTVILSLGAVVLSIIVISVFSFGIYRRAMELKKQRTLLMPPPTLFASPDPKVMSTKIPKSVLDSQNVDQFLH